MPVSILFVQILLNFLFGPAKSSVIPKKVNRSIPGKSGPGRHITTFPKAQHNIIIHLLIRIARHTQRSSQSLNWQKFIYTVDVTCPDRVAVARQEKGELGIW